MQYEQVEHRAAEFQIVGCLIEGMSIRATAGLRRRPYTPWTLPRDVAAAAGLLDAALQPRYRPESKSDEIWAFCYVS